MESSFELTDKLIKSGYVSKPIVGRCGANIQIYGPNDELMHKTKGNFDHKDQIYQELFALQKVEDQNIQLQAFSVSGFYAGSGIRIDPSPIVVSGSDLPTLRVLDDSNFES